MSPRKSRKHYTAQEKMAILRRHLIEKVPVSDLCQQHQLQPTLFYRWQQELFEKGAAALERKSAGPSQAQARRIEYLEAKLTRKDEVLGELLEEHVQLKKSLGVV
jgi:transposase-like protein